MPANVRLLLEDNLAERLRSAAYEHRLTKTAILREALRRELDRLDREGKVNRP
jgi:predicted transcriptional regulator